MRERTDIEPIEGFVVVNRWSHQNGRVTVSTPKGYQTLYPSVAAAKRGHGYYSNRSEIVPARVTFYEEEG